MSYLPIIYNEPISKLSRSLVSAGLAFLTLGTLYTCTPSRPIPVQKNDVETVLKRLKEEYAGQKTSVLIGYDRYDAVPFNPTGKPDAPTVEGMRQERTTAVAKKEENRITSINNALLLIDLCKEQDIKCIPVGLTQSNYNGMIQQTHPSPIALIYCLQEVDANLVEIPEREQERRWVNMGARDVQSFKFSDGKNLEQIVTKQIK